MTFQQCRRVFFASLILIGLWWLIAVLSDSRVFPTPWDALQAFCKLIIEPKTWSNIWDSTLRTLIGTLIGSVVGTVLALASRYFKFLNTAIKVVIYPLFQSVPVICWAFIFVILFGLSEWTPILSIMTSVVPFFMVNIWEGLNNLDTKLIEMGSIYTSNKMPLLKTIILPMLYPFMFAAVKNGFIVAWKVVIIGETFGSTSGMGYLLNIAFSSYHMDQVFAWTLLFAIILILFDKLFFNYIERKFIRKWQIKKKY